MPFHIIIYQFIDQIMFIANSPEHYLYSTCPLLTKMINIIIYIATQADVLSGQIF